MKNSDKPTNEEIISRTALHISDEINILIQSNARRIEENKILDQRIRKLNKSVKDLIRHLEKKRPKEPE